MEYGMGVERVGSPHLRIVAFFEVISLVEPGLGVWLP